MATVDNTIEFSPGPRRKYSWDQWTDGQTWVLVPGEDFTIATTNMRMNVYEWSRTHNYRVQTRILANGNLAVRFTKKDLNGKAD